MDTGSLLRCRSRLICLYDWSVTNTIRFVCIEPDTFSQQAPSWWRCVQKVSLSHVYILNSFIWTGWTSDQCFYLKHSKTHTVLSTHPFIHFLYPLSLCRVTEGLEHIPACTRWKEEYGHLIIGPVSQSTFNFVCLYLGYLLTQSLTLVILGNWCEAG